MVDVGALLFLYDEWGASTTLYNGGGPPRRTFYSSMVDVEGTSVPL